MKLSFWSKIVLFWQTLFAAKTPIGLKLLMIGAILYGVTPLDLMPDLIPILGLSDDALILTSAVYYIWQKIAPAAKQQAQKPSHERDVIDV